MGGAAASPRWPPATNLAYAYESAGRLEQTIALYEPTLGAEHHARLATVFRRLSEVGSCRPRLLVSG